ncbi:MAG: hypothetical protein SGJ04_09325 [Bacteroidota bacterium]|nr:hypothetical protein [Bacteroidota bacterium]
MIALYSSIKLQLADACKWTTKGHIEFLNGSLPEQTLNFGNSYCDNKAKVNLGGTMFETEIQ